MKTLVYLSLLLSFHWVTAQTTYPEKPSTQAFIPGTWQVGLRDGFGTGNLLANRNMFQLQAGYYVVNRLQIGLMGSATREFYETLHSNTLFSAGPFAKYQFTPGRLSPFAELSYQAGQQILGLHSGLAQNLSFTPGLSVGLISHLRVDISYGFQLVNIGQNGELVGLPQIGINYRFGAK